MAADLWLLIAGALSKMLQDISPGGAIHTTQDYPQLEEELEEWLKEVPDKDDIQSWVIFRSQVQQNKVLLPPQNYYRIHSFVIRGYFSVATDSYTRVQSLVDKVLDAYTPPKRLEITPAVIEDLPEATFRYVRLAEGLPLLHQVDITVPVKYRVSIA